MIVFSTEAWSWDLTNYGLTFNEESPYFTSQLTKSYSFPITVELNEDTAAKLGFIQLSGISGYKNKIYGTLTIDNNFYDSYIAINGKKGKKAEITFYYGKEILSVFDKSIKDLPFISTIATPNLPEYARDVLLPSSWPNVTHQFISVFRDDISSKSNYKAFDGFLNNMKYDDEDEEWYFPTNSNETIEEVVVSQNRNIMVPMTYLLEILKVGFKTEGLDLRGELVEDDFFKKLLVVPKNYMEQFATSQYLNYSFSEYTSQTQINNQTVNVYTQAHTPTSTGSFSIQMRVTLSSAMAQYFSLTVVLDGETLYEVFSQNQQVTINETLDINIVNETVFNDIIVTMKLVQQSTAISNYNNFTYEYKEGQLNVFPTVYTIADYMPNLIFREFYNRIKSWLNLTETYTQNAVYLDFIENAIEGFRYVNREHLEIPEPDEEYNKNNLFKLFYPNEDEVMVNASGQTFTDTDVVEEEITEVPFEVLPLEVTENFSKITAVYPEDEEDIMLILYNGTVEGENIATRSIDNRTLSAQDVYNLLWKKWLTFRANSTTVKDSFRMHFTEAINIKEGEFKYNTKRLLLSVRKKRVSTEYYQVDVVAETF